MGWWNVRLFRAHIQFVARGSNLKGIFNLNCSVYDLSLQRCFSGISLCFLFTSSECKPKITKLRFKWKLKDRERLFFSSVCSHLLVTPLTAFSILFDFVNEGSSKAEKCVVVYILTSGAADSILQSLSLLLPLMSGQPICSHCFHPNSKSYDRWLNT